MRQALATRDDVMDSGFGANTASKMPRSSLRHRPIDQSGTNLQTGVRARASRQGIHPVDTRSRNCQTHIPDDVYEEDETASTQNIYAIPRASRQTSSTDANGKIQARQSRQDKHQLNMPVVFNKYKYLFIGGGGVLGLVLLFCVVTTWGFALWATHISDPGTYGPMRGQVVSGVFGGGDSQGQQSRIMSTNDDGHVLLIKLTANDPSKAVILPGPDLRKMSGFPDPTGANVALQVADINKDGNQDIHVTVWSTVYDYPLHRYSYEYTLFGDGNGNLKQSNAA